MYSFYPFLHRNMLFSFICLFVFGVFFLFFSSSPYLVNILDSPCIKEPVVAILCHFKIIGKHEKNNIKDEINKT